MIEREMLELAAQNKVLRDALTYHQDQTRPIFQTIEALNLPDLATPILNKIREELRYEVAVSMLDHFVAAINSPEISVKRNGRCIKKEIIEDLRITQAAAHLADATEKGK